MIGRKLKQISDNIARRGYTPSPYKLGDNRIKPPKKLETLRDTTNEQRRLYKLVLSGDLDISDCAKLMYGLSLMVSTLKAKAKLDRLEEAYIKQWSGVRIIAPKGETIPSFEKTDVF